MPEVWKDCAGYEGIVQVSSEGRVRSLGTKSHGQHLYSKSITTFGYEIVHLNINGRSRNKFVHRLVAEAFIPNPHGLSQVNHKNGDKTDNRVENLEWCTPGQNSRHRDLLYGDTMGKGSARKKVRCVETQEVFGSMRDAGEKKLGKRSRGTNISISIARGIKAGGYTWEII